MGWWDVYDYAVKNPLTKVYQCTYDLGRAAASKTVDGAVKIPSVTNSILTCSYTFGCASVSKVNEYLPGPESREKIVQALTHPATKEAIKFVAPGGAQTAYNIVGSVFLGKNQNSNHNHNHHEQNKYEHVIQQLKVLQAENEKMQQQLNKLDMASNTNNSSSSSSTLVSEQKPEEVITEFMSKGLMIKGLLDNDRVVPSTKRSKI